MNAKTISLLIIDVRTWVGVSRETMEEALKCLKIGPKVVARRSKAMWEILLVTEQETRKLTGSILTKTINFPIKYMSTLNTWEVCGYY